jgi:hypothetical protein
MESVFGGSLKSGGQFCVGAFGRNLVSAAINLSSRFIYFIRNCTNFYTFNAICKDNTALNCITFQYFSVFYNNNPNFDSYGLEIARFILINFSFSSLPGNKTHSH